MTTVLIVDEAHLLSADLLEEIRLLSNLETDDDKLLQIVLVGQPELDEKLDSYGLRQLKQRIAVRTHARFAEMLRKQIDTSASDCRLLVETWDLDLLFPAETIAAVYRHSRGSPRLINTICENALIISYARQLPTVSPDVIEDVAKEFRLDVICMPGTEKAGSFNDLDAKQITNLLNDLYAALRKRVAGDSDLSAALAVEASKHEPYI